MSPSTVDAAHSIADEIVDVWRNEGDPFVHTWEDRFVVDHGYRVRASRSVRGLLEKTGLEPKEFTRLVLYGPDARCHGTAVRDLGFDPKTQVQDPLFGKVGNAGAALAPLLLAAALEDAKAGQRILVVGYGDGADALAALDHAAGGAPRRPSRRELAPGPPRGAGELRPLPPLPPAPRHRARPPRRRGPLGHQALPRPRHRREPARPALPPLRAGAVPAPARLLPLLAKDEFDPVRLSDRIGTVKSFTFDNFAGSPNPPLVAGIVDVDGARLYIQMTDVNPKEVKLGMPVELTFRKIHEAGGHAELLLEVDAGPLTTQTSPAPTGRSASTFRRPAATALAPARG